MDRMSRPAVTVVARATGTSRRPGRPRVLVAERDASTLDMMASALEDAGCRVVARCSDGATAISTVARRRVDVCLIGLDLPGGGVTTTRAINAMPGGPRILVFVRSACESEILASLRAGADSVVIIDIDVARLPRQVVAVAAGEAVLPAGLVTRLVEEFRSHARNDSTPDRV